MNSRYLDALQFYAEMEEPGRELSETNSYFIKPYLLRIWFYGFHERKFSIIFSPV